MTVFNALLMRDKTLELVDLILTEEEFEVTFDDIKDTIQVEEGDDEVTINFLFKGLKFPITLNTARAIDLTNDDADAVDDMDGHIYDMLCDMDDALGEDEEVEQLSSWVVDEDDDE
jgi:hypothetical protein